MHYTVSGPAIVYVLQVNRHPLNYEHALGPNVASLTLRVVRQDAPLGLNGLDGPKIFAQPEVASAAMDSLRQRSVVLGDQHYFLENLRTWHQMVKEEYVDEVKSLLKTLRVKNSRFP